MPESNGEILKEIRDLLAPMSTYFEEKVAEIRRQQAEREMEKLRALLTPVRRKVFPLLFDPRHLTQVQIAEEVETTQPTVSRFIDILLKQGLIDPDETGAAPYKDTFKLRQLLEE